MVEAPSPSAVHFISGLPRSGSTLLAALLKQNPAFHVSLKSPVHRMISALITGMSERNGPLELSDEQRRNILRSVVCEYYAGCGATVVFDSHRGWCMQLAILNTLFPSAKVICCLRNPAWIVDSTERLRQKHALRSPRMFPDDSFQTVYDRAALMLKAPYLGASLKGLRQAWFGEHAGMLIGVRYESLASKPIETLSRLYELLNCVSFQHNAETVSHDEPELDDAIGLPGMHHVSAPIRLTERQTVLPPDLFKHHDNSFWDAPGQNPRGVPLL